MENTGLPVEHVVDEVGAALADEGTAVLTAPPGSGKTTVVPLRLLDSVEGRIVVLEPRRLATRAAARRMASLLAEAVGDTVGYVTRHDRASGPTTRIEVVTEGVLTRRLQSDPSLRGTGLLIFDEVHERNLQTDLGLALSLDTRAGLRPDLMLLAMSATADTAGLSALLGGAPVIQAEGRPFPVDVRWDPVPPRSRHIEAHVASVTRRAVADHDGDVLVFLPGMAEIRRVAEHLSGVLADIRILHGSLPVEDQDRAIAPSSPPFRKVVLSTDIAESSLTVEGVTVVVDSGLSRQPRFDPRTGMTRLTTASISRASAEQRAGRAGRLGPGVAYRLWSKVEHAARRPHIDPEITQVDLAGLAVELAAWGVTDPARLAWLDPPPPAAWNEAIELLGLLGVMDRDGHLTATGMRMAGLPLHPRLARMVVDAGPDAALAVWLATIIDERDPLRGKPGEVPVDIAVRIRLLTDRDFRHPAAVTGALARLREVAADLARRAGVELDDVDLSRAGRVLALAFPDRLAIRRGSPGRFQLRTGTTAVVAADDPLAAQEFLVAADVDGRRKDTRVRLAAAIEREEVARAFADQVDEKLTLTWEGDRLVERRERRLGGMTLATTDRRPDPGEETVAALLERVARRGIDALPWSESAQALRRRVGFMRTASNDDWPDWSDEALVRELATWLGPYLAGATGWDDIQDLDLAGVLRSELGRERLAALDRLAPPTFTLPSGRRIGIDYSGDEPSISVRVQELFGVTTHPVAAGRPLVVELLSPAGRPVQITSDLPGFWDGSWHQVRKEMAGRYPKHPWPEHP